VITVFAVDIAAAMPMCPSKTQNSVSNSDTNASAQKWYGAYGKLIRDVDCDFLPAR
jgi:hypothetical protein